MKSGIELLEDLVEQVKILNKRFEITEQNVKLLLQKANSSSSTASQKPIIMANDAPVKIKSVAPEPEPVALKMPPNSSNGTRVIGKIKDKEGRVLIGKEVKIYNIGNQLVKETKTNRAGEWMCFLPKGSYYAKYQVPGQMPTEASFQIAEGESIVRIASPN